MNPGIVVWIPEVNSGVAGIQTVAIVASGAYGEDGSVFGQCDGGSAVVIGGLSIDVAAELNNFNCRVIGNDGAAQ